MTSALTLDAVQLYEVTMGDEELMREITAALVEDAATQISLLEQAAEGYNHAQCARVAHAAKGSCSSVGAAALAALFSAAESAAKCGDVPGCAGLMPQINSELERLRSAINELSNP